MAVTEEDDLIVFDEDFFNAVVPVKQFGGGNVPPDIVPLKGKGSDEVYILLVGDEAHSGEYVVDIQYGESMSYAIQQLEWDILRHLDGIESTTVIKVEKGILHDFEIDYEYREELFNRLFGPR